MTAEIDVLKKYGKLTPIKPIGKNKHGKIIWECFCDCGKTTQTLAVYLRNGDTSSCGCFGKEQRIKSVTKHGHSRKTSEYEIWKGMNARCNNINHISYNNYGGRGVKICERWTYYANFFADMGPKPSPNHSLDRFPDIDGNYEPTNCRWATEYQQSRNKRNNRWFEKNGTKMIMEDWASYFHVDASTLIEHLRTKTFDEIFSFYSRKLNLN
jgi:hypothetical protein